MRTLMDRGEHGDDLRARLANDPTFHMIFTTVYRSIASGQVTASDWRDAANLAFSEWHARNVGPILVRAPEETSE